MNLTYEIRCDNPTVQNQDAHCAVARGGVANCVASMRQRQREREREKKKEKKKAEGLTTINGGRITSHAVDNCIA